MRTHLQRSTRNFGALTDVSKGINRALGDESGRTVSRRTAAGLRKSINTPKMHIDTAEDIAHLGMLFVAGAIFSKDKRAVNGALIVLLLLFVFYHVGKNENSY